jgi:hypothetical protein
MSLRFYFSENFDFHFRKIEPPILLGLRFPFPFPFPSFILVSGGVVVKGYNYNSRGASLGEFELDRFGWIGDLGLDLEFSPSGWGKVKWTTEREGRGGGDRETRERRLREKERGQKKG